MNSPLKIHSLLPTVNQHAVVGLLYYNTSVIKVNSFNSFYGLASIDILMAIKCDYVIKVSSFNSFYGLASIDILMAIKCD